jgi:hypothetical protein
MPPTQWHCNCSDHGGPHHSAYVALPRIGSDCSTHPVWRHDDESTSRGSANVERIAVWDQVHSLRSLPLHLSGSNVRRQHYLHGVKEGVCDCIVEALEAA